jgi:hypothetical protein
MSINEQPRIFFSTDYCLLATFFRLTLPFLCLLDQGSQGFVRLMGSHQGFADQESFVAERAQACEISAYE